VAHGGSPGEGTGRGLGTGLERIGGSQQPLVLRHRGAQLGHPLVDFSADPRQHVSSHRAGF
jgi:hypothetical protein